MASQGQTPISRTEGETLAHQIGARRYLECSAKTGEGVQDVFDSAIKEALGRGGLKEVWKSASGGGQGGRKKKCVIL
jgi:Rho family protein